MKTRVYSMLVDNTSCVLSRIAGMFSRRGYNIDSLTVGVTANPKVSRMTVSATGENDVLDQITYQLAKLVDVKDVKILKKGESVIRELMLVKIRVGAAERQNVISVTNVFRYKIVDVNADSMIIEATGEKKKLQAFLELLADYEILELARTGVTGLSRGSEDVVFFD